MRSMVSLGFWYIIDCVKVRSPHFGRVSDVIPKRCMFRLLSQRPVHRSVGDCGMRRFSLRASFHLIKQAQEMSLLADWPCVFLWPSPSGTSDVHTVSLWRSRHLINFTNFFKVRKRFYAVFSVTSTLIEL